MGASNPKTVVLECVYGPHSNRFRVRPAATSFRDAHINRFPVQAAKALATRSTTTSGLSMISLAVQRTIL